MSISVFAHIGADTKVGTHLLRDEFGTYVVLSAGGLDIFIRDREKLLEIARKMEQLAQEWEEGR